MRSFSLLPLALAATFALSTGLSASATTITAVGSSTVADGAVAPGSPLNYDFFATGQVNLTDYTVSTLGLPSGGGFFGAGNPANYNQITAPGGSTAFYTGLVLDGAFPSTDFLLTTFKRTSAGDFYVYILDANTDGNQLGNSYVSLGVNGGTAVKITSQYTTHVNEFSEFLVKGALATDTFQIYATSASPTDRVTIGGLTFGTPAVAPTPEPSSLLLCLTGMGSAFALARRRLA